MAIRRNAAYFCQHIFMSLHFINLYGNVKKIALVFKYIPDTSIQYVLKQCHPVFLGDNVIWHESS